MKNDGGKFPRQYLWVSQEFYNFIITTSKELRSKGINTGSADLTHRLAPILKQKINFEELVKPPKMRWRRL